MGECEEHFCLMHVNEAVIVTGRDREKEAWTLQAHTTATDRVSERRESATERHKERWIDGVACLH